MAYASTDDVTKRLGRDLNELEVPLVETRLEDVERMILRKIPDLEQRIVAESVFIEDVIQVESDAVIRLIRNPEGFTSETDGTYSYSMNLELAAGRLKILPEEWRAIGYVESPMIGVLPGRRPAPLRGCAYAAYQNEHLPYRCQSDPSIPFSHGG